MTCFCFPHFTILLTDLAEVSTCCVQHETGYYILGKVQILAVGCNQPFDISDHAGLTSTYFATSIEIEQEGVSCWD